MSGPTPAIRASEEIIDILLKLEPHERAEAFSAVRHNGLFCVACGYGEPEHPNKFCQCENDA